MNRVGCHGIRNTGCWMILAGFLCVTGGLFAEDISCGSFLLRLDDQTGRITRIHADTTEWLQPGVNPVSLWRVVFANGSTCEDSDAAEFILTGQEHKWMLKWTGVGPSKTGQVKVTIITEHAEGMNLWLEVSGVSGADLRQVEFPRFGPIAGNARACIPEWMGLLESVSLDRSYPDRKRAWEYPGMLSMPWIALLEDGGSVFQILYGKPSIQRRVFHFARENDAVYLSVCHDVGAGNVDRFTLEPIPIMLKVQRGGWYNAVCIYGATASVAYWRESFRRRVPAVPAWVRDVAAWVWNRGTSEQVLDPATDLAERLRLPVGVLWHWWHHCPYDAGFPEYFPPREGEDSFREAVKRASEKNVRPLVYMNQRLWCTTSESWHGEQAERWAVKGPDGAVHPEVYNVFTKTPCAPMCMGTDFWRNWYAGMAEKAVKELGVAGIYMDQACSSCACWDASHGHPPGGGSWWVEGFRNLTADIRARCGNGEIALAGEGCGEAWLPVLDLMLSLQVSRERYAEKDGWEPVPLFQMVYGNHVPLFGNYASLLEPPYDPLWPAAFAPEQSGALLDPRFEVQFRLEQARAFLWGQQPTLANYRPDLYETRPKAMAFFEQLVRLRAAVPEIFRHGTLLEPPKVKDEQITIPASRLSIYAGREGRIREYTLEVNPIQCAAWADQSQRPALAAVNITDETRTLRVDPLGWGWTLSGPSVVRVRRGLNPPEPLSVVPDQPFDLALAPREAIICVWERSGN